MYDDNDMDDQSPGPVDDRLKHEKDKDELIAKIQEILNGGHSVDNENSVLKIIQKQRTLLMDIATTAYINKPNNSKLLDSINTINAQIEKSIRDDRKERLKDRELEDNKANFATFVNALSEISSGRIVMPNYGEHCLVLDPLAPIYQDEDPDNEIKDEELYLGRQILDSKKIQESFDIEDSPTVRPPGEEDTEEFDPNA